MTLNLMWTLSAFSDEAGTSTQAQIQALQRAGLSHIDIRNIDEHNISTLPLEHARRIKTQLDEAGIATQMFGTPIGKIDIADDFQTDRDKLRHLAELAPILACNALRIFSYFNAHGASHDEWKTESLRRLKQLRDDAEELNLVLYHENERHIFGDLGDDVLALAALRNANFKLIFDFDNFNQSGESVRATWDKLADLTDSIHLKDSTKDNKHVPVGQGNGQVREILADALARGWSGPLAVEPHLSHSGAVAATGPSGQANESYASMKTEDSFHIAVDEAKKMLNEVGANWK